MDDEYGKVVQWDTVKGSVKALGGDGDNLWIHVTNRETGRQLKCRANRETARKVATYLFEEVDLRFEGVATWSRNDQGRWDMELFEIKDFRPLKGTAIDIEVAQFQSIESTWSDPLRALDVIRHDNDESRLHLHHDPFTVTTEFITNVTYLGRLMNAKRRCYR